MPIGKISFNVHAHGVRDLEKLRSTLREIDPVALLVMDGLGLLLELHAVYPNMIAIDREYPDVLALPNTETPESWLARKALRIGSADIWCYTTNEPMLTKEVIDWHVRLIKLNAKRQHPLKLVILNLSVGTPSNPNDWALAEELLRLCDQYRSWCIVGLHEYAAVTPTSGFIGGTPDSQGFTRSDQWPIGDKLEKIKPPSGAMWHCGRFFLLNEFCKIRNIQPPRIILTEHGFDHLGDLEQWYKTLILTYPYTTIQGWKTLVNQWKVYFPQWSEGRVLFETIRYLDQEIYKNTNVEAQLLFCWGWIDRQWENFDVSTNEVFHSFLKDYVRGQLMGTPISRKIEKPNPSGLAKRGKITTASRVRSGNGTLYSVIFTTSPDDTVLYYPQTITPDDMNKYSWIWVEPVGSPDREGGWVALVQPMDKIFEEEIVIPDDSIVLPLPPFPAINQLTQAEKTIAAEYLEWIHQVVNYLSNQLRKG